MSINITIENKGLFRKKLSYSKLQTLLNKEYNFGIMNSAYVNDGYNREENIENKSFIVYRNKGKIGRGFWFSIPLGQKEFYLTLNVPSTTKDIMDMYDFIGKIADYLGTKFIIQDSQNVKFEEINENFRKKMISDNYSELQRVFEVYDFTLFGAKNPIWFPKEMEEKCKTLSGEKLENYVSDYVNSKQLHDYYYMKPSFFNPPKDSNKIIGVYALTKGVDSIIPKEPYVSYNCGLAIDTSIDSWLINVVFLKVDEKGKVIDSSVSDPIFYEDFMRKIDKNKLEIYDRNHYILKGLSEEELKEILNG